MIIYTNSPDETIKLGCQIGKLLAAGDCLCLSGGLGAGKTLLVQGIAKGFEVGDDVTSPTFTVLQVYQGRLPVYHYDLYRLRRAEELFDIGFSEYMGPSGVTVIEWPDKFPDHMPEQALWLELTATGECSREIRLMPRGERYEVLIKELLQNGNFSFGY